MSIFSKANEFDKAFKLGKLFDDINLSENSPCITCDNKKAYDKYCGDDGQYHICLDRDIAELNYFEDCKSCIKKINYDISCKAKLAEYEKHSISTRKK
jgi:plasmid rolling circle replication initiator protein Rep